MHKNNITTHRKRGVIDILSVRKRRNIAIYSVPVQPSLHKEVMTKMKSLELFALLSIVLVTKVDFVADATSVKMD